MSKLKLHVLELKDLCEQQACDLHATQPQARYNIYIYAI